MFHARTSEPKQALTEIVREELRAVTGSKEIDEKLGKAFTQLVFDRTFVQTLELTASGTIFVEGSLWTRRNARGIALTDLTKTPEDHEISREIPGFVLATSKYFKQEDGSYKPNTDSIFLMPESLGDAITRFADKQGLRGKEKALSSAAERVGNYLIDNQEGISFGTSGLDTRDGVTKQSISKHIRNFLYKTRSKFSKLTVIEASVAAVFGDYIPAAVSTAITYYLPKIANEIGISANTQGTVWLVGGAIGFAGAAYIAYHASQNPTEIADADRGNSVKEKRVKEYVAMGTKKEIKALNLEWRHPVGLVFKKMTIDDMPTGLRGRNEIGKNALLKLFRDSNGEGRLFATEISDANSTAKGGGPGIPFYTILDVEVKMSRHEKLSSSIGQVGLHFRVPGKSSKPGRCPEEDSIENIKAEQSFSWSGGVWQVSQPTWWSYPGFSYMGSTRS